MLGASFTQALMVRQSSNFFMKQTVTASLFHSLVLSHSMTLRRPCRAVSSSGPWLSGKLALFRFTCPGTEMRSIDKDIYVFPCMAVLQADRTLFRHKV